MKFVKKVVFIATSISFIAQNMFSVPAFQSMSKEMTQNLLHAIQYTPFGQKDSHFQQLLHSTLSQLQNTDRITEIDATIDIIISNLDQRKNDSEEVEISFMTITISHLLRIAAQRLYHLTAYIKNNLHYWQHIDQQSTISYCLTHFPTLWGTKIGNHLAVKERILTAEKLYTAFITHLGTIFRLIHTLPTKIDTQMAKNWISTSFAALSDLCGEKENLYSAQPITLKTIKKMLITFERSSKNNLLAIKKAISKPTFIKRDFGKIIATIGAIAGIGALLYYKTDSIKEWYQHASKFAQESIWNPVKSFTTNIFLPQETSENLLLPKETVDNMLQTFNQRKDDIDTQIKLVTLTEEDKTKIQESLIALLENGEDKVAKDEATKIATEIVNNHDVLRAHQIIEKSNRYFWNLTGKTSDVLEYLGHLRIVVSLFLAQLLPTIYRLDQDIVGILSETLKAIARFDREFSTTRKLALLAPAVLSLFALYKGGATIYNYITKKDYHLLQKSLKELETATICSIDQPDNNQNYGLFIFILESLKQGVVQTISSRYTDKQDLLCDLARLESPELTFEQRYKLIAQIKQEYSIFQKQ